MLAGSFALKPDGDFLPLTDDEREKWAKAVDQFAKTANTKRAKALVKAMERHAPLLAFCWTTGVIFGPRAVLAFDVMKQRRARAMAQRPAMPTTAPGVEREPLRVMRDDDTGGDS